MGYEKIQIEIKNSDVRRVEKVTRKTIDCLHPTNYTYPILLFALY